MCCCGSCIALDVCVIDMYLKFFFKLWMFMLLLLLFLFVVVVLVLVLLFLFFSWSFWLFLSPLLEMKAALFVKLRDSEQLGRGDEYCRTCNGVKIQVYTF